MVFRAYRLAAAAALVLSAMPATAQQFSDSYQFLEAVRKADGAKVNSYLEDKSKRAVNWKDSGTGETALHIVAKRRDMPYLVVLSAQPDVNLNLQDKQGETPLMAAVGANWEEGVARLLKVRANVDIPNSGGETPLIRAVLMHNEPIVRMLLDAGANPDVADYRGGLSARDYAERESRWPRIAALIEATPKGGKNAGTAAGPRL